MPVHCWSGCLRVALKVGCITYLQRCQPCKALNFFFVAAMEGPFLDAQHPDLTKISVFREISSEDCSMNTSSRPGNFGLCQAFVDTGCTGYAFMGMQMEMQEYKKRLGRDLNAWWSINVAMQRKVHIFLIHTLLSSSAQVI